MDLFQKLPAEVQLQIIRACDSRENVASLIRASPAMYSLRKLHWLFIVKYFLGKDLPGDLIQDALAIICFPDLTGVPTAQQTEVIESHLTLWGTKTLSNPMQTPVHELDETGLAKIYHLDNLVCKIKLFIEDYIDKATNNTLRGAYSKLPSWATMTQTVTLLGSIQRGTTFKDLSERDQTRLVKGFLQYELMCKLYPLRPSPNRNLPLVADWPWGRLFIIEHNCAEDKGMVDASSPELLQCVHEYLRTIYGAVIVKTNEGFKGPSRYPGTKKLIPEREKFPFPYGQQFEPELMLGDLDTGLNDQFISFIDCLASCGFNLAMSFLTAKLPSSTENLNRLWDEISSYRPEHVARSGPATYHPGEVTSASPAIFRDGMVQFSLSRGHMLIDASFRRMCRQRAWAFFDTSRFHPPDQSFPDDYSHTHGVLDPIGWRTYYYRELNIDQWRYETVRLWVREFVPSVELNKYQSPWVCDMGPQTRSYPTLRSLVRIPFWKRRLAGLHQI